MNFSTHYFFSPKSKWRCTNFKTLLKHFNTKKIQLILLPTLAVSTMTRSVFRVVVPSDLTSEARAMLWLGLHPIMRPLSMLAWNCEVASPYLDDQAGWISGIGAGSGAVRWRFPFFRQRYRRIQVGAFHALPESGQTHLWPGTYY